MATDGLSWNEFRKQHKGMEKEEISALWQQYKDGEYDPEASTNIDPNHGHDLDYIAEVEEEMALEESVDEEEAPESDFDEQNEVKREPEQQQFLNELNHDKINVGLKLITHW